MRRVDIIYDSVKLLSINEARKLLSVRFSTVKKLVETGTIKSILINGRRKIPFKNLLEYVNHQSATVTKDSSETGIISVEETQTKIESIINNYSGG